MLHLFLSRRTKTLKSKHRLSLSLQAGGSEYGFICCCLKAGDLELDIFYFHFPHGHKAQIVGNLLQSFPSQDSYSRMEVDLLQSHLHMLETQNIW